MARRTSPWPGKGRMSLVRFHLRVGTRVALALFAPVIGGMCGAALLGDLDARSLAALGARLFGDPGRVAPAAALAALVYAGATVAVPRVFRGLDGWMRHLPATEAAHRRAATVGVAVAEAPLLAVLLLTAATSGDAIHLARWSVALALLAVAAAVAASPWSPRARAASMAAALLAGLGTASSIVLAAALLAVADRWAGPLRRVRPARRRRVPAQWLSLAIAMRAGSWRLLALYPAPALVLAATAALLANNDLPDWLARRSVRLGAGVALALLATGFVGLIAQRRPPWPWSRSLPVAARRRVIDDAVIVAVLGLPILIAAAAVDALAAAPVLLAWPALCLHATGASRSPESSGWPVVTGLLGAGVIALVPAMSLVVLAAVPLVVRWAETQDRHQRVTRWIERHNLAAGDPLAWSGR